MGAELRGKHQVFDITAVGSLNHTHRPLPRGRSRSSRGTRSRLEWRKVQWRINHKPHPEAHCRRVLRADDGGAGLRDDVPRAHGAVLRERRDQVGPARGRVSKRGRWRCVGLFCDAGGNAAPRVLHRRGDMSFILLWAGGGGAEARSRGNCASERSDGGPGTTETTEPHLAAHEARSTTSFVWPLSRHTTAPAVMLITDTFLSLPPTARRESPSCSLVRVALESQQHVRRSCVAGGERVRWSG